MTNPFLYSNPYPANAHEVSLPTPPELLAVETEPCDGDVGHSKRELQRRLTETSSQLNIHRERYNDEANTRLGYELENRNLVKRVRQVERLNAVLAAECDRQRLVVNAAVDWVHNCSTYQYGPLLKAVETYEKGKANG